MKILVTGGPVHAKIDAVKFVTNRFKGGLTAKLADELREQGVQVTYLCSKGAKEPRSPGLPMDAPGWDSKVEVVYHDDFHDYRQKVKEMAPDFDAVVLGAAVANLIPTGYYDTDDEAWTKAQDEDRRGCALGAFTPMPLEGKFPSPTMSQGTVSRWSGRLPLASSTRSAPT